MTQVRRFRFVVRAACLLASVGSTAVVVVNPTSAAVVGPQPSALVAEAYSNAEQSGWVHEVVTGSISPSIRFTMVNDVGTTMGRQVTKFSDGGRDTLIAFETRHRIYDRANAKGLSDYQVTRDTSRYANQWMVDTPSNPTYASDLYNTYLESDFSRYVPTGPLSFGPIKVWHGQRVREIIGTTPRAMTGYPRGIDTNLYVVTSKAGVSLPVELTVAVPRLAFTVTWTSWGRSVTLTAPVHTIPHP